MNRLYPSVGNAHSVTIWMHECYVSGEAHTQAPNEVSEVGWFMRFLSRASSR